MTSLSLLVVSDTHANMEAVRLLKEDVKTRGTKIDAIILTGDIANIPMGQHEKQEQVTKAIEDMKAVLASLQDLNQTLIYVPGNHDPGHTMTHNPSDNPNLGQGTINVHYDSTKLAEGLTVVGLGGCGPCFRDGKKHWVGYPYLTDEALGTAMEGMLAKVNLDTLGDVLIISHMGPDSCTTTHDSSDLSHGNIHGGSAAIDAVVRSAPVQATTVGFIHGHAHHGRGMGSIGRVPVINPGALDEGRYAVMELIRGDDGHWVFSALSLFHVPGMKWGAH